MSYEPTQWKAGDTVTSAKLNKLEQGVANGGGIQIIHAIMNEDNPPTLDKTWQEIHDGGFGVIVTDEGSIITYSPIILIYEFEIIALARLGQEFSPIIFTAGSANDYPSYGGGQ